jgi:hypothetical protein
MAKPKPKVTENTTTHSLTLVHPLNRVGWYPSVKILVEKGPYGKSQS